MKKYIVPIILICFLSVYLEAQGQAQLETKTEAQLETEVEEERNENVFTGAFRQLLGSGSLNNMSSPNYVFDRERNDLNIVSGSQFLFETWADGTLLTLDNKTSPIKGRYDIHNDEIQILVEGKIQALFPKKMKAVVLNEYIFIHREFKNKNGESESGFVELLVEGKTQLYLRRTISTQKTNAHPLLGTTQSNDIKVVSNETFLYSKNGKMLKTFKPKKKTVLTILSKKKKDIKKFMNENHSKLKNTNDLIQVFMYYNKIKKKT